MKEYIEREAVVSRLEKVNMDTYYGFTAGVQFGVDHAIQCIKEAPAADVAPVRHGRWVGEPVDIDGHTAMECSECHKVRILDEYCSSCGARMDKEDEHETD